MPPHGYVASSPQPHPYMWGVQVNRIFLDDFKHSLELQGIS